MSNKYQKSDFHEEKLLYESDSKTRLLPQVTGAVDDTNYILMGTNYVNTLSKKQEGDQTSAYSQSES